MRGAVAAGDPHTAEAARDVLAAGGNAVDAAVAAAFVTFTAEPLLSGAGGGGILLAALPGSDPVAVDFFPRAPGLGGEPEALDFAGVDIDFGSAVQTFHAGRASVAAPMALEGLLLCASTHGTLPISEIVAPAVRAARDGVALSSQNADVFRLLWPILTRCAALPAMSGGRPPAAGERVPNPALAALLDEVGRTAAVPSRFGDALLAELGCSAGGRLSRADLDASRPVIVAPLEVVLGEWRVLLSPRVGGHRVRGIARALFAGVEPDEVALALRMAEAAVAAADPPGPGSTTHVSVIDGAGGAASVTLTNGEGCGHLVPSIGVQPNNFMGETDLNPEGFHAHAPGALLPTMIAPTIALHRGEVALAVGSGGSNRIKSVVSQVLWRIAADPGCRTLEAAIRAPRLHAEGREVWVELDGWVDSARVERALRARFERIHAFPRRAFFFGGAHAVRRHGSGELEAFADPRRGGAARIA